MGKLLELEVDAAS